MVEDVLSKYSWECGVQVVGYVVSKWLEMWCPSGWRCGVQVVGDVVSKRLGMCCPMSMCLGMLCPRGCGLEMWCPSDGGWGVHIRYVVGDMVSYSGCLDM